MAPTADGNGYSKAGTIGAGLGTAIRVLRSGSQGGQLTRGIMAGGRAFLQNGARVLRILWLQVIGFLFLCFAAFIGSKALHEYQKLQSGVGDRNHVILATLFAFMFLYFGVSSFWRARK